MDDVKVAVLEERLENFETLVSRLDSAIEKIAEVNNNVSRMLAVHEERITKQEEVPFEGKLFVYRHSCDLTPTNIRTYIHIHTYRVCERWVHLYQS